MTITALDAQVQAVIAKTAPLVAQVAYLRDRVDELRDDLAKQQAEVVEGAANSFRSTCASAH